MDARFYTFSKRYNSLSRPSGEGDRVDFLIKSLDSVRNMKIELAFGSNQTSPAKWNYCHLPDFSRYYFVSDWAYQEGIWTASLSEDCLATWADEIRSMRAAVLYSSSSYRTDLMDTRILAAASYQKREESSAMDGLYHGDPGTPMGTYVLTALSAGNSTTGAATTYFMSAGALKQFADKFLDQTFWEEMKQLFDNPLQNLIDCYYIPVSYVPYYSSVSSGTVKMGGYDTGIGGVIPNDGLAVLNRHTAITIPWILGKDSEDYNPDFRNCYPYTKVELTFPFCGTQALDTTALFGKTEISIDYSVDFMSGAVQALAHCYGIVLAEFSGNIKVSLPVGQVQESARNLGIVGGAAQALFGLATKDMMSAGAGLSRIGSSFAQGAGITTFGGMQGSVLGDVIGRGTEFPAQDIRLSVVTQYTSDTPSSIRPTIGNVCSAVKTLSTLSGYCQTSGFSLQAAAYDEELKEVNALMDSGVYL